MVVRNEWFGQRSFLQKYVVFFLTSNGSCRVFMHRKNCAALRAKNKRGNRRQNLIYVLKSVFPSFEDIKQFLSFIDNIRLNVCGLFYFLVQHLYVLFRSLYHVHTRNEREQFALVLFFVIIFFFFLL